MRIAIFTETFLPKIDGIVTVVCLLLDHLSKRGVEYMVVAPGLDNGEDHYNGNPVVRVPGVPFPIYPELKVGPPTPNTYRAVKAYNPDLMHFIHPLIIGAGGILMAKRMRKPTLASFHLDVAQMAIHHGLPFTAPALWQYTKTNFNVCDYALAPSKLVQEQMIERDFKNVGLWKRGVNIEKFNPNFCDQAMRNKLSDGNPDDVILLYVGRLSKEKQIANLRPVVESIPNVRLAIVGDGPDRDELHEYFAGTRTTFMGYMTGDELSTAYASADIFTFTSALESFGLVMVEAMASGLPVVTTLVGGAKDIIQEGYNGYAYDVGDVDTLTNRVATIASNPNLRKTMSQNARAFAETQTWDAMMDEVIECYQDLIAGTPPKI